MKLLSPARFALAVLRVVYARARGFRTVSTVDEMDQRLDLCLPCEFLSSEGDCRVCGCPVDSKVVLATESCPKRKWPAVWEKKAVAESR